MSTEQPVAPPAGRAQRRVRNLLLDARFQLKFAAYFVVITVIISAVVGVVLLRTTDSLFERMNAAVDARARAAETSRELGRCALNNELSAKMNDPEFANSLAARSTAIDAAFDKETAATEGQRLALEADQRRTWWVLLAALIGFLGCTALAAIVITHRIVGPLFRIKRMAREVSEGVMRPPTYGLRPGDELKDTFELIAKMIAELRSRTEGDLAAVDAALTGDPAALERLKADLAARLAK